MSNRDWWPTDYGHWRSLTIQQHSLTHARVANHHQGPALPRLDRLHQPVQHITLGTAARQPRRTLPRRETSGHLHNTNAIPHPWPAH